MTDSHMSSHYLPSDDDIVEKFVAFLLRCAESKRKYDNPTLMSEITAKRILSGLKKSGFVLMKEKPQAASKNGDLQPRLL